MSLSTGSSLYYPFIHPRSTGAMKAALLYWDRVRRIVPRSVERGGYVYDDDENARLLAESELLVATSPSGYEAGASKRFLGIVAPRLDEFRMTLQEAGALAARREGIHVEKMLMGLLDRLEALGIAHRFGPWVSMREEVAALYMYCLASEMGERMGTPLLCDSLEVAALGQALLFGENEGPETNDLLVSLGIELPSPISMDSVSTEEIISFSEKRRDERVRFREAIEEILNKARSAADPHQLEDFLQTERGKVASAVRDYRATVEELQVATITSTANLATPALAASAVAAFNLSPATATVLAGIGLAIAGTNIVAATRGKARAVRSSSPYHYLHAIEMEFG